MTRQIERVGHGHWLSTFPTGYRNLNTLRVDYDKITVSGRKDADPRNYDNFIKFYRTTKGRLQHWIKSWHGTYLNVGGGLASNIGCYYQQNNYIQYSNDSISVNPTTHPNRNVTVANDQSYNLNINDYTNSGRNPLLTTKFTGDNKRYNVNVTGTKYSFSYNDEERDTFWVTEINGNNNTVVINIMGYEIEPTASGWDINIGLVKLTGANNNVLVVFHGNVVPQYRTVKNHTYVALDSNVPTNMVFVINPNKLIEEPVIRKKFGNWSTSTRIAGYPNRIIHGDLNVQHEGWDTFRDSKKTGYTTRAGEFGYGYYPVSPHTTFEADPNKSALEIYLDR